MLTVDSGKTSVGVALTHLFKFGHTQSDDVTVKKAAPVFLRNVNDLLHKQTIVIADKCVIIFNLFGSQLKYTIETIISDNIVNNSAKLQTNSTLPHVSSLSTGL